MAVVTNILPDLSGWGGIYKLLLRHRGRISGTEMLVDFLLVQAVCLGAAGSSAVVQ